VVAATSEVVTNGVSQYSRNERNANAGIVVGMARNYGDPAGQYWNSAILGPPPPLGSNYRLAS
jgi:uncharacterized FAD-dependent dehydrogenase